MSSELVNNRLVYYVAGFDPRGARHYYNLFKKNSKEQSPINGIESDISSRKKENSFTYSWEINSVDKSHKVKTTYKFLAWNNIVQSQWSNSLAEYYLDLIYCLVHYICTGVIFKFAKASPKQMIGGFYPIVFLIFGLLVSLFSANLFYSYTVEHIGGVLPFLLCCFIFWLILKGFQYIGNKIGVFWLLRIFVFGVKWSRGKITGIDNTIYDFVQQIKKDISSCDSDEVLLVSHSVGTMLVVEMMAKIIKESDKKLYSKIKILTLGECIPLISFQKKSFEYRKNLQLICNTDDVCWVDITSKIDGACFPLLDFVGASGVNSKSQPLYLSARFHLLYDKITYKKIRRDWYKAHFLYLMANQSNKGYDFFRIVCGKYNLEYNINKITKR